MKNSQFIQEDLLNINSNLENEYSKFKEIYQSLKTMLESSLKPVEKITDENGVFNQLAKDIDEISKIFDLNFKNGILSLLGGFGENNSNDYLGIFKKNIKENSGNFYNYNNDNRAQKNYHNYHKTGAETSSPINLTMNINALDANSFSKSKNQIMSEALLLIQRAAKNF